MKRFSYIILVVSILCISAQSYSQVGIGTTTPASSSMLEIQSTAKGVLIPRMTTAQRTVIASPANGLLVFDTDKKSFWFYNGTATTPAWKELVTGSSISDTDGDTKVEVEKSADEDIIRLSTAGTEYVQIGSDGVIKLGNKGASTLTGGVSGGLESDATGLENYTKITGDGSLSYVGNATRWEDLKVPVNSVKIKKTLTEPTWRDFLGNTALLWFDNGDDVVFTVQMPHAWKEGSRIYPHVHWVTETNAGSNVSWALEYTWSNAGEVFPTTATITGNVPGVGSGNAYVHNITPLGTDGISGKDASDNNHTLSSMLVCRLYRGSDSYSGDAGLLEIDFHYQVDSDGSNQEYTKQN
jgi:hypothetical protein